MDFVEEKVIDYLPHSDSEIIEHKEDGNINLIIEYVEKPETDEKYCV